MMQSSSHSQRPIATSLSRGQIVEAALAESLSMVKSEDANLARFCGWLLLNQVLMCSVEIRRWRVQYKKSLLANPTKRTRAPRVRVSRAVSEVTSQSGLS